jgi:hypothetical protein
MERTHEHVALRQMKFCTLQDHRHTYLQVLFDLLFSLAELLNMAVFRNYEVVLGQTLNFFVYNSVILCGVIYL